MNLHPVAISPPTAAGAPLAVTTLGKMAVWRATRETAAPIPAMTATKICSKDCLGSFEA